VAEVINQVQKLQINFKRFTISFLPRLSVKFVFTFARDAINSQLSKDVVDAVDPKVSRETCIICLEVTDSSEMLTVDNCLHRFCFSCMKQHVEAKLHHGILPGCPHDGCKVVLDLESGRKYLPPKLLELLSQRLKEASIPDEQKVYCPYSRCSALMSASDVYASRPEELRKCVAYSDTSVDCLKKCVKCNGLFCIKCKVPWHERLTCYQFKMLSPTIRPEEARLQDLAKQKLWRQCVRCNHMIELSEGCFHGMTCR
ncbi:LOW QUALITY PROTEIN: E3 ubiquitin-protein ligase RSL1-like, partial [Curcuma longa]|uniref:LOW QUALITY PROTEIN: E3 ubiquitin-protein ligase RSL1-like n=1 Tax=Curcuma longa TaxID=136217 RepID=UPI003D9F0FF3